MSEPVSRHLRIFGRVQGVWYRESMRRQAEQLKLSGWVRNRLDGSVEAVVQGEAAAVERIIQWARRGPEQALVTHIDLDDRIPQVGQVQGQALAGFLKLATC